MRKKLPRYGDKRIRKGFLFLPMSINHQSAHEQETRWLEFVTWEELFQPARWGSGWWMKNRFLDGREEIERTKEYHRRLEEISEKYRT